MLASVRFLESNQCSEGLVRYAIRVDIMCWAVQSVARVSKFIAPNLIQLSR